MNNKFKDTKRHTIPQWRIFDNVKKTGELDSIRRENQETIQEPLQELEKAKFQFDMYKSVPFASELVSLAFFHNNYNLAKEAASFLLKNQDNLSSKLILKQVNTILGINEDNIDSDTQYNQKIKELKAKVKIFPNNPYYWIDLAFYYSAIGQNDKAHRCILTGLQLRNNDRFILRSASRFFQHNDEPDRALYILRTSDRIKTDPWILASEISISEAIEKTSRNINIANKIVESQNFSPFSLSEINSALGTIQIESGNLKKGKQYIKQSLINPNDNSLAQAEFIKYQKNINIPFEHSFNEIPLSYEADARAFSAECNWHQAFEECKKWQSDIPYSSRPAIFGSYLAGELLCDYEAAKSIAQKGITSNKDDESLLNNYAYSIICLGELDKADNILKKIKINHFTSVATKGLLQYRRGDIELGRDLYEKAIDMCNKNEANSIAVAYFHLASEEIRQGSPLANKYKEIAEEKFKQIEKSGNKELIAIYNNLLGNRKEKPNFFSN